MDGAAVLASCRCVYMGAAPPTAGKSGVEAMQEPLQSRLADDSQVNARLNMYLLCFDTATAYFLKSYKSTMPIHGRKKLGLNQLS